MICDLVIPALDERSSVDALFDALEPVRSHVRHVILADNGSTDGTPEAAAARGAVVVIEPRRGYGSACLRAIAWIEAQETAPDVIAFLDADLSDDPASLPALLAVLEEAGAAIVIGSRVRCAEPGALNPVQRFGNALACALMRVLGGRHYSDLGPFRAVRFSAHRRLAMADPTWGWTVEMQMKAALLDLPCVEVDVPYRRRHSGRSKISGTVRGVVTAGSRIITTIVVLWWRRGALRRADPVTPGPVTPTR